MSSDVVPTSDALGSRRKYFTSRIREVLSARSSMRPSRQKCQLSLCVIVESVTPVEQVAGHPDRREQILRVGPVFGVRGIHHQVELVELLPHLRRDDLAHGAGVLARGAQTGPDRVGALVIEGEELDDVALGGGPVPFREFRRVAGGVHQRLPLLCGADGQVEHEIQVHLDEPRDVLRALDVAAHPVDRIGDPR